MKSNIMKVISFIVLIVGLIGSIASGAIFQTYDFDKQRFVFNSELTIGSIIDVILFFIVFYTFTTILQKLEDIENNISEQKKRAKNDSEMISEMIMSNEAVKENVWKCPKCGELNSIKSKLCKNCATWK